MATDSNHDRGNLQTYLPGHLRFFDGKVHPGE